MTSAVELDLSDIAQYGKMLRDVAHGTLTSLKDTRELLEARKLYEVLLQRRAVERGLLHFTHDASKRKWTRAEYKRTLFAEFYRLARAHFGVYDRPESCADCNEHCYAERYCITLSEELNLYACLKHAAVHECCAKTRRAGNVSYNVDCKCPCRSTSEQTDEVCVFSGKIVSKRLLDSTVTSKCFSSEDSVIRSQAGYQFRLAMMEIEKIRDDFENSDVRKLRVKKNRAGKLPDTQREKVLDDVVVSTVDVTKEVFVEADSMKKRTRDDDGDESGSATGDNALEADAGSSLPELVENTSANSSSDTTITKPIRPTKKRLEQQALTREKRIRLGESNYFLYKKKMIIEEAERYLASVAEKIMVDILFDKDVRALLNKEQMLRLSSQMISSLNEYHARQKRAHSMPIYTECLAAFFTPQTELRLLRLVEYDREQISVFSNRAVVLWKICYNSPAVVAKSTEFCSFKKFVVALLYCMRKGLSIPAHGNVWTELSGGDEILVVQNIPSLAVDLPAEDQLSAFGKRSRDALSATLNKGALKAGTQSTEKQRPKSSRIENIPQRIEVDGIGTVTCRSFLPTYLHEEAIEDTSCYAASDVSQGLAFFKDCIASFSDENRRVFELPIVN